MQRVDTLIHPGQILTMAGNLLENYSIAADCGLIVAVLPKGQALAKYEASDVYHLPSHLVMPGLINMHTHASMNLLRGLADDLKLHDWLQKHIWPAEAAVVSPEFVKDGMRLAIAEMIRGGVTCFNDNYFYADELATVVAETGMRATLSECFFKFSTPWSPTPETAFARTERLMEFCKSVPTLSAAIFPHAPYSTDLPLLKKISAFAHQHDLIVHTHLLESRSEIDDYVREYGKRPIALWDDLGLIGPKTLAVHMTHANDEDLEIICARGAHVVHCPESNMKLASRIAPIQKMLNIGINVALGTDGAVSNNDLDMFTEMRSAAFLSKISMDDPLALITKNVLLMATLNGAKALHLNQQIGSIERGKALDVIAIDFNRIETLPCYNPKSQLVYATPRTQVTHSWVNGKILLENRKLRTIDETRLITNVKCWQEKLKQYAQLC